MSELAQLFTGLGLLITALVSAGSLLASLRNASKINSVAVGVAKVIAATDGMKTELVALTAKSSLAEGIKQGRDEKGAEIQAQGANK